MKIGVLLVTLLALSACAEADTEESARPDVPATYDQFLQELAQAYREKPEEYSRAYALVKEGMAGPDWLLTVHGLPNNRAACEEIAAPYNDDPSLSALPGMYTCLEINSDFEIAPLSLQ